jgi:hypothetical protein
MQIRRHPRPDAGGAAAVIFMALDFLRRPVADPLGAALSRPTAVDRQRWSSLDFASIATLALSSERWFSLRLNDIVFHFCS